ncbi:hypothetical protein HKCCE2091_21595, partial [Rhodobacterales bacterium HKCCE2091]|nr:hypothetical protein [Rhodobacterales bacterium HKCCE2091]
MTDLAVLTGDIVASTDLGAEGLAATMHALNAAAGTLSDRTGAATAFARRGGDGWQMVIDRPLFAFRATLYCAAVVRRLEDGRATRIAVATGDGTLPPGGDPNAGHGPAFTASGRALDDMDRHTRLARTGDPAEAAAWRLADEIVAG